MSARLDDMSEDAVAEAALALLRYRTKRDARGWYAMLRTVFGLRGGQYAAVAQVTADLDVWMQAHPSWVGLQLTKGVA